METSVAVRLKFVSVFQVRAKKNDLRIILISLVPEIEEKREERGRKAPHAPNDK